VVSHPVLPRRSAVAGRRAGRDFRGRRQTQLAVL